MIKTTHHTDVRFTTEIKKIIISIYNFFIHFNRDSKLQNLIRSVTEYINYILYSSLWKNNFLFTIFWTNHFTIKSGAFCNTNYKPLSKQKTL